MKIQVRYFASLRESTGLGQETVDAECHDVAGLRSHLIARGGVYAECLATHRPVRVAVNQVMASEATLLSDQCEVAFFPPVTGG